VLPAALRRIYISQDNDDAGTRAAESLAHRAGHHSIEPIVLRPRARDFDDDLRQISPTELAAWVRVQLAPEDATCLQAAAAG
jgi:hypothetical protein